MLKETISNDLTQAMKRKEEVIMSTLRMLIATMRNREIEKKTKLRKAGSVEDIEAVGMLTDEEILDSIRSEVKKRRDAIAEFQKASRTDLVDKESAELDILQHYLPPELRDDEIIVVIKEIVSAMGATQKDFGRVMGITMG
ncbi:MAG: GatB/YqeY domain-containing protein, partial [Candidatus Sungbacteria bacterium]|nr:GatB/YqeY domain-containing protein [Candidatus Sungbacteria bacterium]